MADNGLTFPIHFDLQAGVDEAAKDWDKYAKKLEAAIAKRAVKIRLGLDTRSLDNIDAVKQRLAQLKITPITNENKAAIRELVKELKELAKAMEKVSNLRGIELPELQAAKAAKLRKEVEQADEKLRLSQERVRQAQERLTLSQERAAQQARKTSYAYGEQSSYLQNLIRKMVAVWSVECASIVVYKCLKSCFLPISLGNLFCLLAFGVILIGNTTNIVTCAPQFEKEHDIEDCPYKPYYQ